jgi:hypothetical protein
MSAERGEAELAKWTWPSGLGQVMMLRLLQAPAMPGIGSLTRAVIARDTALRQAFAGEPR